MDIKRKEEVEVEVVEVGMHLLYSVAPEPKAGQPLIIGRLGKTCIMIRREQRIPGETLTAGGGGCQIVTLACIVSNDIFYHVQSDRPDRPCLLSTLLPSNNGHSTVFVLASFT